MSSDSSEESYYNAEYNLNDGQMVVSISSV